MILRRLTRHLQTQNWAAIGLEFIIVVFGVFLGLQAQEWSEGRDDRRREMQLVADMIADLEIDRPQYATGMRSAVRRISAANASLVGADLPPVDFDWDMPDTNLVTYELDLSTATAIPAARLDALWGDIVLGYFPAPSTSTYDAIVGAGEARIIRDRRLVREIQLYANLAQGVTQQNAKLFTIRANVLNIGLAHGLAPSVTMAPDRFYQLVEETPELAAAIRLQATFAVFHHGQMKAADARAASLQSRLEAYLENGG